MKLNSGYPFWLVKNGLPYDYPKLEQAIKTDVLIIGGGISGALAAYSLVNKGIRCITVDARTIALGSTCASTSLLQYEIDVPLHQLKEMVGEKNAVRAYELCVEAIEKLARIADDIGFSEFELKKSLYFTALKKDKAALRREFKTRKEHGFEVEFLEEEEIRKRYNIKASSAILSKVGAQTNAYLFTHKLHQYCIGKGTHVYDRTPVAKIIHHKNNNIIYTEQGHKIEAKKIIYATGYETVKYVDKKIVDLNITYSITSEQYPAITEFWKDNVMIWNMANPYLYLRTTGDKRMIIGGRDEKFFNMTRGEKLIKKKSVQLLEDFRRIFPHIPFKQEFSWCGVFGNTKDGLPFIGTDGKKSNGYFALGFGGNGIVFSLIAAEIIAGLITGKQDGDAEIFSFNRI
jgi:glycine/D-amino acid oxidase-like deaminating enzyme